MKILNICLVVSVSTLLTACAPYSNGIEFKGAALAEQNCQTHGGVRYLAQSSNSSYYLAICSDNVRIEYAVEESTK